MVILVSKKIGIALSSLALYFLTTACGGQSAPVVSPRSPASNPTPTVRSLVSSSTQESSTTQPTLEETVSDTSASDLTVKMRHPYQEPSNAAEEWAYGEFVEKRGDIVAYGEIVRFMNKILFAKSALGVAIHPTNGFEWVSLYNTTRKQMRLEPYPALETILNFLMSKDYNQTEVDVAIEHEQEDQFGNFVKIQDNNPDLDLETFNTIMSSFFAEQERAQVLLGSQWTMYKGPNNSGYIDVDVNLPLVEEWTREFKETFLSPAVILGDTVYFNSLSESKSELNALSTQDGSTQWNKRGRSRGLKSPIVLEDRVISIFGDHIYALDANNGEDIWDIDVNIPLGTPITRGNTIYTLTVDNDDRYSLESRSVQDGSLNWRYNPGHALSEIPAIKDDIIYTINYWSDFVELHALDKNGRLIWKSDTTPSLNERDFMMRRFINPTSVDDFLFWVNVIQRERVLGPSDTCIVGFDLNEKKIAIEECINGHIDSFVASDGKDVYIGINDINKDNYYIARYTINDGEITKLPPINVQKEMTDLLLTNDLLFVGTYKGVLAIERENPNNIHRISDIGVEHLSSSNGALYATGPVYSGSLDFSHITKFSASENPIEEKQSQINENPTIIEKTISYAWNVKPEDLESISNVPFSFDGDREIVVRLDYNSRDTIDILNNDSRRRGFPGNNDESSVFVFFENTIYGQTLAYSLKISSDELKSDPTAVITELENKLLNGLKARGVLSVDIVKFKEGNQTYGN